MIRSKRGIGVAFMLDAILGGRQLGGGADREPVHQYLGLFGLVRRDHPSLPIRIPSTTKRPELPENCLRI